MSKITIIDPPSGWRYGFPRPVPQEVLGNDKLGPWLIEKGYPEKDVELAIKWSRYWESDDYG